MPLSPKQLQSFNQSNKRICIWVGAVRSGKTFSSILKLVDLIKNGPPGDCMIIGVNRESIQRNILGLLYKFLGFPTPSAKSNEVNLYGRRVYFVGAHDESSVRRIQGATLAFAYVDEAACIPEPFWKMLLSRLSVPGAQLLATCNPDGPSHWLKKKVIDDKDLDLVSWNFGLDDNPSLDESFKSNIKKEYTGMWYRRYILGEWALAHGAIYDNFTEDNIYDTPKNNPTFRIVGIDYGTTNPTAAVMVAINPKIWPQISVESEYYWDSSIHGRSKTDQELVQDIKNWIGPKSVTTIYIDPAAASLKLALRNENLPVVDAKNDVLVGIKIVSKFISNLNLLIHRSCRTLIEQLQSYTWDGDAADKGLDKPVKSNDHLPDCLRYCVASAFPNGEIGHPDENISIDQLRRSIYGSDFNTDFYGTGHGMGGY